MMRSVDQKSFEWESDILLKDLIPCNQSELSRRAITKYLADTIKLNEGSVFGIGSSALKVYLPEGDIDVVISTERESNEKEMLTSIFMSLFSLVSHKSSSHHEMAIRNIEFVNARTNLVRCIINNISVDVTVNQTGATANLLFLEKADRIIGFNHLFKRSILLIKCWCVHESARYSGHSIVGSKSGMLSTYALNIMVLYLFNKYTSNFTHPFSVLRVFLNEYASFNWDCYAVTLNGPLPLSLVHTHYDRNMYPYEFENRFQGILDEITHVLYSSCGYNNQAFDHGREKEFVLRACNIIDPIDSNNNLGISVSKKNLDLLKKTFMKASEHLENLLVSTQNSFMNDEHVFNHMNNIPIDSPQSNYMPIEQPIYPMDPSEAIWMNNMHVPEMNTSCQIPFEDCPPPYESMMPPPPPPTHMMQILHPHPEMPLQAMDGYPPTMIPMMTPIPINSQMHPHIPYQEPIYLQQPIPHHPSYQPSTLSTPPIQEDLQLYNPTPCVQSSPPLLLDPYTHVPIHPIYMQGDQQQMQQPFQHTDLQPIYYPEMNASSCSSPYIHTHNNRPIENHPDYHSEYSQSSYARLYQLQLPLAMEQSSLHSSPQFPTSSDNTQSELSHTASGDMHHSIRNSKGMKKQSSNRTVTRIKIQKYSTSIPYQAPHRALGDSMLSTTSTTSTPRYIASRASSNMTTIESTSIHDTTQVSSNRPFDGQDNKTAESLAGKPLSKQKSVDYSSNNNNNILTRQSSFRSKHSQSSSLMRENSVTQAHSTTHTAPSSSSINNIHSSRGSTASRGISPRLMSVTSPSVSHYTAPQHMDVVPPFPSMTPTDNSYHQGGNVSSLHSSTRSHTHVSNLQSVNTPRNQHPNNNNNNNNNNITVTGMYPFLDEFFPTASRLYRNGELRADLRTHPLQKFNNLLVTDAHSTSSNTMMIQQNTLEIEYQILEGDLDKMQFALDSLIKHKLLPVTPYITCIKAIKPVTTDKSITKENQIKNIPTLQLPLDADSDDDEYLLDGEVSDISLSPKQSSSRNKASQRKRHDNSVVKSVRSTDRKSADTSSVIKGSVSIRIHPMHSTSTNKEIQENKEDVINDIPIDNNLIDAFMFLQKDKLSHRRESPSECSNKVINTKSESVAASITPTSTSIKSMNCPRCNDDEQEEKTQIIKGAEDVDVTPINVSLKTNDILSPSSSSQHMRSLSTDSSNEHHSSRHRVTFALAVTTGIDHKMTVSSEHDSTLMTTNESDALITLPQSQSMTQQQQQQQQLPYLETEVDDGIQSYVSSCSYYDTPSSSTRAIKQIETISYLESPMIQKIINTTATASNRMLMSEEHIHPTHTVSNDETFKNQFKSNLFYGLHDSSDDDDEDKSSSDIDHKVTNHDLQDIPSTDEDPCTLPSADSPSYNLKVAPISKSSHIQATKKKKNNKKSKAKIIVSTIPTNIMIDTNNTYKDREKSYNITPSEILQENQLIVNNTQLPCLTKKECMESSSKYTEYVSSFSEPNKTSTAVVDIHATSTHYLIRTVLIFLVTFILFQLCFNSSSSSSNTL